MQKTLVLYSRICPGDSKFTIQIFNMLKELPNVTAIKIDANHPFDIPYEQEFIKQFDNVILLFTMNWFNVPWSMSRYMAEVWRTGEFNLENKNIVTVVTTGSPQKIYGDDGFGWTAMQYLNNLGSVFKRLKANWQDHFFFHDCLHADENGADFKNYLETIKNYYLEKINK